jgi:Family of unknown function (DUF6283)
MSPQKPHACSTCPWLKTSDRDSCFPPEALERSTVDYLKNGHIHYCHSAPEKFCNGFLSYAVHQLEGGLESMKMARLAIAMKLLDPKLIPKLETFESIEEMLSDHQARMKFTLPSYEDDD